MQWLRTELEMDDRVPQYEVQFRQGGLAYEYEIHGETGEILSMDVDD
ncbi:MAG: PepSY domain-containing protein [Clostridia bacterium]|nr:PepSY domain-containing protein [Clostridia bacterium]